MTQIHYVTSNREKFQEASLILHEIGLRHANIDLDEVQADSDTVVRRKAMDAVAQVKAPVIVDDISLTCPGLGGLPGPYIKSFLQALGEEGLANLVIGSGNPTIEVQCRIGYATPESDQVQVFLGTLQGTFVLPRGSLRYGKHSWNPIFQPEGCDRTFGEMTMEEIASFSERRKALIALHQWWQSTTKNEVS